MTIRTMDIEDYEKVYDLWVHPLSALHGACFLTSFPFMSTALQETAYTAT